MVKDALQLAAEVILDLERLPHSFGIRVVDSGRILVVLALLVESLLKCVEFVLTLLLLRLVRTVVIKTAKRSLSVSFHLFSYLYINLWSN